MEIILRSWHFGDEERLIYLFDTIDRTHCDLNLPEPFKCNRDEANWLIRHYVDMAYDHEGYACAIEVDGRVVGHIQFKDRIDVRDDSCVMEVFIHPDACGKGIATEAVKQMIHNAFHYWNIGTVFATMLDSNKAAIRLAENAGMRYCGTLNTEVVTHDGRPCMKVVYCISRSLRERKNSGVEIVPCVAKDIDGIIEVYNTADFSYDEYLSPIEREMSSFRKTSNREPSVEQRKEWMQHTMRYNIDHWGFDERSGLSIHRTIITEGEIAGLVSVSVQKGNRMIEGLLRCMMTPKYCGKGIATEAVKLMLKESFGLRSFSRITAWVYASNKAACRVLEKNGFQLEGTLRKAVLCNGNADDCLAYGILRSEFEALS